MRLALLGLAAMASACSGSARTASNDASACQQIRFDGAIFIDCRADPMRDRLRLIADPNQRKLSDVARSLGPEASSVRFAMNGGMYDDRGNPIGLAIAGSKQIHDLNRRSGGGNKHMLPNGIFSVGGDGWHIRTTDAYAQTNAKPTVATQSGPMLLIGGNLHPRITPDGPSRYVRNAVGLDRHGMAHFVISDQPVSFGKLARLFRDRLDCADALYLDGAVSALWDPAHDRIDSTVPLGPILVVEAAR